MKLKHFLVFFILLIQISGFSQVNETNEKDTIKYKNIIIESDEILNENPFKDCEKTDIYITFDNIVKENVFLLRNFEDQCLEICGTNKAIPASKIYGFSLNKRFFRSTHKYNREFVFAERLLKGKTSFYCSRNIRDLHYKNDYSYFITHKSDTTKMIFVSNGNIKEIANKYFVDCKSAYKDAMNFVPKYRTIQRITLPITFVFGVAYGFIKLTPWYENKQLEYSLLSVAVASLSTYVFFRLKARYLHPNDMIRIVAKYNSCL
ncbi:MAG: hypothetical protein HXX09_08705 [Bacteroidetes bacterium]|nr:hypothetical protein [Bacteroidota bacterium]